MKKFRFYGHNLPITFCYKYFGNLLSKEDNKYLIIPKRTNLGLIFEFTYSDNKCEVKAKVNNETYYQFTDEFNDPKEITTFSRLFKNKKYYFVNSELVKYEKIF
jgi:hypothetical protein